MPLSDSDEQYARGPQVAPGQQRPSGAPQEVSQAPCTHAPSLQIDPGQHGWSAAPQVIDTAHTPAAQVPAHGRPQAPQWAGALSVLVSHPLAATPSQSP